MQDPAIIVRPMVLEDIPELAELYRQFWDQSSDVPEMIKLMERLLTRDDYVFLSAVEGSKLIGSVYGIVCEIPYRHCRPFFVIQNVIVDEDHRRKGVASLLFDELEHRAREKGCIQCDLITNPFREAAVGFYQGRGFAADVGFRKPL